LSFGAIGGSLVSKLVNPTQVVCSWAPDQRALRYFLPTQTKSDLWTAAAGILGKTDAAVRQELSGFDAGEWCLDDLAELLTLLLGHGRAKVMMARTELTLEAEMRSRSW
jgi:hypothetical protein